MGFQLAIDASQITGHSAVPLAVGNESFIVLVIVLGLFAWLILRVGGRGGPNHDERP